MRNLLNDDYKFAGDPSWTQTEFRIANILPPILWDDEIAPQDMADWQEETFDPDCPYGTERY
jgi:hypothetical protein